MEESYLYERGAQANQVPTQKSKVLSEAGRKRRHALYVSPNKLTAMVRGNPEC